MSLTMDRCINVVVSATPNPGNYLAGFPDAITLFDLGVIGGVGSTHFLGKVVKNLGTGFTIDPTKIKSSSTNSVQDSAQSIFDNARAR